MLCVLFVYVFFWGLFSIVVNGAATLYGGNRRVFGRGSILQSILLILNPAEATGFSRI